MDTLIQNGSWAVSANGLPIVIGGLQEQLQRAFIRLNVKQGSFAYDPTLGSRLTALRISDADLNEKALFLAQEALKDMPQVTVLSAVCSILQGGISITFSLQTAEGKGNITIEGE